MDKNIEKTIKMLIEKELELANGKYFPFSSIHEGYGVIKEEMVESKTELKKIKKLIEKNLFGLCMNSKNIDDKDIIKIRAEIKKTVIKCIIELIQVGAMADKLVKSLL